MWVIKYYKADFRFAPSQLETPLLCNDVSHWLGESLESALYYILTYLANILTADALVPNRVCLPVPTLQTWELNQHLYELLLNNTLSMLYNYMFVFSINKCVKWWRIYMVDCEFYLLSSSGPFYSHGLTLIPAWISNHMPSKMWDEIIYPFLNFNGATVAV